jgi:hypothetical protein
MYAARCSGVTRRKAARRSANRRRGLGVLLVMVGSFLFRPAASKRPTASLAARAYHEGGVDQSRRNTASLPLLSHSVAVNDVDLSSNT